MLQHYSSQDNDGKLHTKIQCCSLAAGKLWDSIPSSQMFLQVAETSHELARFYGAGIREEHAMPTAAWMQHGTEPVACTRSTGANALMKTSGSAAPDPPSSLLNELCTLSFHSQAAFHMETTWNALPCAFLPVAVSQAWPLHSAADVTLLLLTSTIGSTCPSSAIGHSI